MRKFKRGQSMFELLVAVFVIGVTLTALVALVTSTISNTNFSKQRTLAAKSTNAAVEWLREERDKDWNAFTGHGSNSGSTYCLQNLSWSAGSCGSTQYITGTVFIREATIIYSAADPNRVEAQVSTSWSDGQGEHESRVSTYFTNWRSQ